MIIVVISQKQPTPNIFGGSVNHPLNTLNQELLYSLNRICTWNVNFALFFKVCEHSERWHLFYMWVCFLETFLHSGGKYGILLSKLFWTAKRKNCSSDREKKAESQEFAKFLRSLEQFIQKVKGQNNFW